MGRGKIGGRPAVSLGGGVLTGGAGELVDVIGVGDSDHRLAQEKVREQEENEANPSRGLEGTTTARGLAWLG